jgi:hypothetical protein
VGRARGREENPMFKPCRRTARLPGTQPGFQ